MGIEDILAPTHSFEKILNMVKRKWQVVLVSTFEHTQLVLVWWLG